MSDLQDKTGLLIGQSPSMLAGLAEALHHAGLRLILGHTVEDAAAVRPPAAHCQARTAALTLDNPAVLDQEMAALGRVDVVVIAPGWFKAAAFLDSTPDDWESALRVNFEQNVYALRAAAKHLKAQGQGGSILVLSSVAALTVHADLSAAATSMAALHVPARLAAVELAPYGITVNVVAMGWVAEAWTADYVTADAQPLLEQAVPMQRLATFADIAAVCRLLASPDARYLTGAVLAVDGGYTLHKAGTAAPPRAASGS